LFFYDEALAFAAGHRPCALCRRPDYKHYQAAAGVASAQAIDEQLHVERLDGKLKRTHAMTWSELPSGAYVDVDGVPHVVLAESLRPWTPTHGYGTSRERPRRGIAVVLTPPLSIRAMRAGYSVQIADL
jgi:hypothetical protein